MYVSGQNNYKTLSTHHIQSFRVHIIYMYISVYLRHYLCTLCMHSFTHSSSVCMHKCTIKKNIYYSFIIFDFSYTYMYTLDVIISIVNKFLVILHSIKVGLLCRQH